MSGAFWFCLALVLVVGSLVAYRLRTGRRVTVLGDVIPVVTVSACLVAVSIGELLNAGGR